MAPTDSNICILYASNWIYFVDFDRYSYWLLGNGLSHSDIPCISSYGCIQRINESQVNKLYDRLKIKIAEISLNISVVINSLIFKVWLGMNFTTLITSSSIAIMEALESLIPFSEVTCFIKRNLKKSIISLCRIKSVGRLFSMILFSNLMSETEQ